MFWWIIAIVATAIASFGVVSRGSYSLKIASFGATVWLASVILACWYRGWRLAGLLLFVTLVVGRFLQRWFQRLLFSNRNLRP